MEKRNLSVSKSWKNNKNVPSIRLMGIWLKDAGFTYKDSLEIKVSDGEILIKKM